MSEWDASKIPTTLKFGGLKYKVESRSSIEAGGQGYYGECLIEKQIIQIASSFPADRQIITLIHESIHAIDDVYGLNLKETQVERLAMGITAFLMDNGFLNELKKTKPVK
jgi:hypothetical protein